MWPRDIPCNLPGSHLVTHIPKIAGQCKSFYSDKWPSDWLRAWTVFQLPMDQCQYLGNCPATPPLILILIPRLDVAVHLFSDRLQMTSKDGENKEVAHEVQPNVSLMFLPHFDVLCWSFTVQTHGNMKSFWFFYDKKSEMFLRVTPSMRLSLNRSWVRTNENVSIIQLIVKS